MVVPFRHQVAVGGPMPQKVAKVPMGTSVRR
jgi:hypothetical protein